MKHLLLKTWLLMLCLLTLGGGNNAWAEEVTFSYEDYKGQGTTSTGSAYTMNDKSYVSIGESKFYGNTSYAQFYASGTITITPKNGATITKVAMTTTSTSYNGYQSNGKYTASTGSVAKNSSNNEIVEWTGSATSAFTLAHEKQIRWTSIVVTYTTSGGGSTPTALSAPTNLSSSNVTTTGATLSWDAVANASSYTVKIGETEYSNATSPYLATGLTAGTQYTWTVKAVGDGTNYTTSAYAANANFTTELEQGGDYTHDVLTNADLEATSTTYADFSNVSKNTAVYAGNSAKNNGIQLRSSNSNSGIVSTTSGGKIKTVTVTWNSNTTSGRTIDVYGSNTAYTSATNLYNSTSQGTKLGSIVKGTSTSVTVTGDYDYVGIRSNSGSLNIDNIDFAWEPAEQKYDVTFDLQGHGEAVKSQSIAEGEKVTEPTAPTATGYTFGGWYKEAECTNAWNFSTDVMGTSAVTLYAKWTANDYTITYNNVEGATNSNPATYTIETATINLADASKEGYIFQGWFDNDGLTGDAVTTIAQGSTGDKTFWAKWVEVPANPSVVTFNVGEHGTCEIPSATEETVGAGVALPNVTANEGWVFKGWSTENPATAETIVSAGDDGMYHIVANTTLYAYYKVKPATPTFSPEAGEIEKGTEVTISCTTENATIYYTTNGDDPTAESATYSEVITVNAEQTIKAIAILDGEESEVASAAYTIATHTARFSINGEVTDANNCIAVKGEAITFPADPSAPEEHVFIGWKKGGDEVTTPQDEAIATVDKATEVMGTQDVTYYAVWAVGEERDDEWTISSSDLAVNNSSASSGYDKYKGDQTKDKYTVNITDVYPASGTNVGKIQFKSSSGVMYNKTSFGKIKKIEIVGGSMNVYQNSSQINSTTGLTAITKENTPSSPVTYMFSTNDNNGYFFIKNGSSTSYITSIKVYYAGTSYSDYCTKVSTKIKPTLSFANPTYNATMGEEFQTPALNNPQHVTVSYSSSAESVASVNSETGVVELVGAGTTTITASFAGDETYNKASASYQLVVKAATPVFASLEELVAADLTTGTEVTVSFENVPIKSFQTVGSARKGVYFDIQKGGNDIEIYFTSEVPAEWAVGGTLSGTLTNCPWKLYSGTWELAPASGWAWSNLTYNAPANYAPAITTQPVSATYEFNASATNLTVAASGNPAPTYQWYSNTTNSNENGTVLTGETNASYKPSTATAGTFYYYCVATNSEGSAASSVATITVKEPVVASLPFAFDAGKNDISSKDGMSQSGLGSDYSSSPKLKFDSQGDNVIINFNEAAKKVTYTIKGNNMSGTYAFDVMESADGVDYTTVHSHTSITDGEYTGNLASTSRFVKFVYTTKDGGNVALGKISIIAASVLDDPELKFGQTTYTFFTNEEMQVVATSAAGSTGAITYALTAGDEDAFLIDENTGDIVCETAGTYTVTATIAQANGFTNGIATCTVKIKEPIVGNSIIVAEADGKYYAMTTTYNSNGYFTHKEIKKIGDKYVVSSLDDILFYTSTADDETTIQSTSTNEYVQSTAAKNISYTEDEYKWKNDGKKLTAATESYGTLQYNTSSPRFTTYASKTGQYATIVNLADVVLGFDLSVSAVGYATLCLPFNATVPEGATVYTGKYNSENGSVKLNEVEGDKIKAGEGYIVANEGTHTFTETSDEVEAPENNHLKGVIERTQLSAENNIYIFANQSKGVGFYRLGTDAYLAANKAYLLLPAGGGVNAREFVGFGDDIETGIDAVDALPMTDGKYLKDGKIVIVKNGVKYNVNGQRTR